MSQIEGDRVGNVKPTYFGMLITLRGRPRTLPSCNQKDVVLDDAVDARLQIWEGGHLDKVDRRHLNLFIQFSN